MSTTDCNVSRCLLFLLIGAMGFCEISGCKGSGGGGSLNLFGPTGPAPTISSLSPSSATAGSPSFTLTINGSNFASGDEIGWTLVTGSVSFPGTTATFVSSTQLTAQIPAALIASPTAV